MQSLRGFFLKKIVMAKSANRFRNKSKTQKKLVFNRNYLGQAMTWLNEKLAEEDYITKESIFKISWIFLLITVYIFFQLNYEDKIRKMEKIRTEMNESRASYISEKSQYLFQSKQSEVEKRLKSKGLSNNKEAPIKVSIKQEN